MTVEFDDDYTKILYNIGKAMIYDDKGDLGYANYHGRRSHTYHGKNSPNHPSPWHHYQLGSVLVLLSQFLSLNSVAKDAQELYNESINENDDVVDNNV